MTIFCASCGAPNTDQATKCIKCGVALKHPKRQGAKFKGTMIMSGGAGTAQPARPGGPASGAAPPTGAATPQTGAPKPASSPEQKKENLGFQKTMLGAAISPPKPQPPASGPADVEAASAGATAPTEAIPQMAPPAQAAPASPAPAGSPAEGAASAAQPAQSAASAAQPAQSAASAAQPAQGAASAAQPAQGAASAAQPAASAAQGAGNLGAGSGAVPGGPGVGAPPPAGPPAGGGGKKVFLFIGIGCLVLLVLACLGAYIGIQIATDKGQAFLQRAEFHQALSQVVSGCATDPDGPLVIEQLHPERIKDLQAKACKLDDTLLQALTNPSQSEIEQGSEVGAQLGLDEEECFTLSSGNVSIEGCHVIDEAYGSPALKIVEIQVPAR